jgi:predicted nucleic acid-binding protein
MKPRLFLDTNVIMDLLSERHPFYMDIARIATLSETGDVEVVASALSFATSSYFLTKYEGATIAKEKLRKLRIICPAIALDESIIDKGLNSHFSDIEDAFQYYSALSSKANFIITRNAKDFKQAEIIIMSPPEFLSSFQHTLIG